jgi:hypothetical protein
MTDVPRVFTLEEANALVPRLNALVALQMDRRANIERGLERLGALVGAVPDAIEVQDGDAPEVCDVKRDLLARIEEYQSAWHEIEELGAVLKDARIGLLDFYGDVDGRRVWLCWKYGEPAVGHYHGLNEGFSGRKRIEPLMRHRHLN